MHNISFLLLLLPSIVWASIPIKHDPIPGGIAVVNFETNHHNPKAFYRTLPLYVQNIKDEHWQVLIGIPLMEKSGKKSITIKDFANRAFVFEVKEHKYQEQHITLKGKNTKYVNPNPSHMTRIKKERYILARPKMVFSDKVLSDGAFSPPVEGFMTSPFGVRRFYNGQERRQHTGLDYAGDIGAIVKAPANSRVLLTGNYFFNGNTIFLDHGQGLISVYIHLDKILVKQNQLLNKGEVIGTIGKTGRATNPHLHWGIYLNRTAVNPNLLLGSKS